MLPLHYMIQVIISKPTHIIFIVQIFFWLSKAAWSNWAWAEAAFVWWCGWDIELFQSLRWVAVSCNVERVARTVDSVVVYFKWVIYKTDDHRTTVLGFSADLIAGTKLSEVTLGESRTGAVLASFTACAASFLLLCSTAWVVLCFFWDWLPIGWG